jgi:hypothetical protein
VKDFLPFAKRLAKANVSHVSLYASSMPFLNTYLPRLIVYRSCLHCMLRNIRQSAKHYNSLQKITVGGRIKTWMMFTSV